jgi:N-acetylmuramoyl-L-alanine amidase
MIDPGHGGTNPGCVRDDFVEKEHTLKIGMALDRIAIATGIHCALTRWDDRDVSFRERGEISREFGATLVLCVHVNANRSPEPQGMEWYYWPGNSRTQSFCNYAASISPRATARVIACEIDPEKPATRWLEAPRRVIGCHQTDAILCEVGYASSPNDRTWIESDGGVLQIAACLLSVIGQACAK